MSQANHNSVPPIIHYSADGIQKTFSFPFIIFDATQLHVFVDDIRIMTGFSVHAVGQPQGGHVTFDTAPENNKSVILKRHIPIRRISDFIEGGELSSHALNREFDQHTALLQQIDYKASSALRFPDTEIIDNTTLPSKELRANRLLGFNHVGEPTVYSQDGGGGGGGNGGGDGEGSGSEYTQSGHGAISRSVLNKMTEYISVRDFGAVGDGVTDDTNAFQNALNAHDRVYIPTGTYRISQTIQVTSSKTLCGDGDSSVLQTSDNLIDMIEIIGKNNHLTGFTIKGGETGLRLYGKETPCCNNTIRNLFFENQNTAIELDGYIDAENICAYNTLADITIYDAHHQGILLARSGNGQAPIRNLFSHIHVLSKENGIDVAAFTIESAQGSNILSHCSARIYGDAPAIILIGTESDTTIINNFYGYISNAADIHGIHLQTGSQNTALHHIHLENTDLVLHDESDQSYTAQHINTGENDRSLFGEFASLYTHQQYWRVKTLAPIGAMPIMLELDSGVHLASAQNGSFDAYLPKADSTNKGAILSIIKTDSSNEIIMIREIDGQGPNNNIFTLAAINDRITVISDGSIWRILHTNIVQLSSHYHTGSGFYFLDSGKNMHLLNASSGVINVHLPIASAPTSHGRVITIKKSDSSSNAINITEPGGSGPDYKASIALTTTHASITLMSNNSAWLVISRAS